MRCAVKDCSEDAFHLVSLLERFGAKQPHYGSWYGVWLCEAHGEELANHLKDMGVKEDQSVLSGLPPIPSELYPKPTSPIRAEPLLIWCVLKKKCSDFYAKCFECGNNDAKSYFKPKEEDN